MNNVVLLIPHYNNPEGLKRSLASIEASEEIDILIVDDGSTKCVINEVDTTAFFKACGTVKYIYLEHNKGIEHALNTGLRFIVDAGQYIYIARMDSDDSCIGRRFSIQKHFLDQNENIMLVGSNVIAVSPGGDFLYNIILPKDSHSIKKKMFLNSMFMHPSVMFRAEIIQTVGYYPLQYDAAEDYAYFFKIVNKYETANIQEFLLHYEINPKGISVSKRKQQVASRIKIIRENFYFGFYPIYGLLRNLVLYVMPQKVLLFIKKRKR